VGQATLYRHFPDRTAVGLAIFAEQLERLERLAAEYADDPTAFFVVLRAVVQAQMQFHGLIDCVRREPGAESDQERLKHGFVELIRAPLQRAKAAALVRPDLGIDDVFLLTGMVGGALQKQETVAARAAAGARALTLCTEGLGLPSRTG
jgi:AcrR family transcriptional regulator